MGKLIKWLLAGAGGLAGLISSFFISPTVFECKLFTACHEINIGYAVMSLFSSQTQSAISNEQLALQIAHSISLTLIGAILGFIVGLAIELQTRPAAAAAQTTIVEEQAGAPPFAGNAQAPSPRPTPQLEMTGLDGFGEYYLKIDASELAQMPRGLLIGRDADGSEMIIDHETISRRHARLTAGNDAFMLEDLSSTNGTRLNGRNLPPDTPARLHANDRISFGSVNFRVALN